jgi:hypothetical protein
MKADISRRKGSTHHSGLWHANSTDSKSFCVSSRTPWRDRVPAINFSRSSPHFTHRECKYAFGSNTSSRIAGTRSLQGYVSSIYVDERRAEDLRIPISFLKAVLISLG